MGPATDSRTASAGMTRLLIIPAAGRGSRLGSDAPKALCPVGGRPMIAWLLEHYRAIVNHVVIVVAPSATAAFDRYLETPDRPIGSIECVVQDEPTGMLPAVLCARAAVERQRPDQVWITWCDQIGISERTVQRLAVELDEYPAVACVFPTVGQEPPYIHFPRAADGRIAGVLQRREGATMPAVGESDAGLFALRRRAYLDDLVEYAGIAPPGDTTREQNFLPFLPWLAQRSPVRTFDLPDAREAIGVNTPDDLKAMEVFLRERG